MDKFDEDAVKHGNPLVDIRKLKQLKAAFSGRPKVYFIVIDLPEHRDINNSNAVKRLQEICRENGVGLVYVNEYRQESIFVPAM